MDVRALPLPELEGPAAEAPPSGPLPGLLARAGSTSASDLRGLVDDAAAVLGADHAKFLVADYGLVSLQELGPSGPVGARHQIEGTIAGRCFVSGDVLVAGADDGHGPVTLWVPVAEGSERLGVLEVVHPAWSDDALPELAATVRLLVLEIIGKRRYTDTLLRCRRAQPLDLAAEMQWDLLPPLTCATEHVSVSGILEPAYEIGGDSFDYALNPDQLDFAIVDAVGHGMSAVLMAVATVSSLRNSRREELGLERAYRDAGAVIADHFGQSYFVTGQIGSLDLATGRLSWINAGHPRPLLVRDGTFVGELSCRPSLPMGLGGDKKEIAVEALQPGDRVMFFTDGVIETRSESGEQYGIERLADHLVRASLDQRSTAETVRRLAASVMTYNPSGVDDDATFLLIDYHG